MYRAKIFDFITIGIAAGEEHVGDLGVLAEIARELIDVLVRELHVVEADELRPAEAEGAVGVTGLTVGWEEEGGLVVLVLDAGNGLAVDGRHVVGHLAGRVGIQFELDLADRGIEVGLDPRPSMAI